MFEKNWDIGKYWVTLKYSDTLWYSKSKSKESRQYHFFDFGYLVYKKERMVGVKLIIGKLLFFVGWQKPKKGVN